MKATTLVVLLLALMGSTAAQAQRKYLNLGADRQDPSRQPVPGVEEVVLLDADICDTGWGSHSGKKSNGCYPRGSAAIRNIQSHELVAMAFCGNLPSQKHIVSGKVLSASEIVTLRGLQGEPGQPGEPGVSVLTAALPIGDANCPTGGTKLVAANGTTYACNGKDGAPSLAPSAPNENRRRRYSEDGDGFNWTPLLVTGGVLGGIAGSWALVKWWKDSHSKSGSPPGVDTGPAKCVAKTYPNQCPGAPGVGDIIPLGLSLDPVGHSVGWTGRFTIR